MQFLKEGCFPMIGKPSGEDINVYAYSYLIFRSSCLGRTFMIKSVNPVSFTVSSVLLNSLLIIPLSQTQLTSKHPREEMLPFSECLPKVPRVHLPDHPEWFSDSGAITAYSVRFFTLPLKKRVPSLPAAKTSLSA